MISLSYISCPASSPDPLAQEPLACPVPGEQTHFRLLSRGSVCSKNVTLWYRSDFTRVSADSWAHCCLAPRAFAGGSRREGYSMGDFRSSSVNFQLPVAFLPGGGPGPWPVFQPQHQ